MAKRPARTRSAPAASHSPRRTLLNLWAIVISLVIILSGAALVLIIAAQPQLNPQSNPNALVSIAAAQFTAILFILATLCSLASLKFRSFAPSAWYATLAATGVAGGITLAIPWEMEHLLGSTHFGLSNLYQVSIFTLLVIGTLSLGFDRTTAPGKLLPFTTPILTAASLFSVWLAGIGAAVPTELIPALQNSILPLHVAANFIGYGCFAVAAATAVAILFRAHADKHRRTSTLPTQEVLEKLSYRTIAIGFPVFSLAILLGCVWAYQAWGGYWSWDPKETWALIVWLIYAAYLHTRSGNKTRPAVLAWWLLLGFLATLFCYIGVNMFLSGLHSYGSLAQ